MLAFTSDRDGDHEIFVVAADGSGLRQLTHNATDDLDPAWSPDGRRIAFFRERWDTTFALHVVRADGSRERRVRLPLGPDSLDTTSSAYCCLDWSSDGRLALVEDEDVYVAKAVGDRLRPLTASLAWDTTPSWSPNGERIAFASDRRAGEWGVYVMSASRSSQPRLVPRSDGGWAPDWAPDGRAIAFEQTYADSTSAIVVSSLDGRARQVVALAHGVVRTPTWQPVR
jgi:Tol biopolymer transport system component